MSKIQIILKSIKNKNFNIIDSEISPVHLIKFSIATVSSPFASTSVISKNLGIPSCYFDPTGSLIANDIESNGIIIKSKEELFHWTKKLLT